MKKTYLIPLVKVELAIAEQMLTVSIVNTGGDADIQVSDGEAPDEADVKEQRFGDSIFD